MQERQRPQSIVYVVDDDISVRNSLSNLFRSVDLSVETFDSPAAFLQRERLDVASCIVLDIRMPGLDGYATVRAMRQDPPAATLPPPALPRAPGSLMSRMPWLTMVSPP